MRNLHFFLSCLVIGIFVLNGYSVGFSDQVEKEIGGIYKIYLDSYNLIFSQVQENDPDLSMDTLRDIAEKFSQTVNSFVQTEEGKGFACLATMYLTDIVVCEGQVNNRIKHLENESDSLYRERVQKYIDQIRENQRKDLAAVFASSSIPENSYLKIAYHRSMISLVDLENKGVWIVKKPLIDAREHCDALMNGPLFQENPVILQPPIPVDLVWAPKTISSLQEEIVTGIRRYFLTYKLDELAKKNEKLGINWTEEELSNTIANENQFLVDAYPLTKYPFLARILGLSNNITIQPKN